MMRRKRFFTEKCPKEEIPHVARHGHYHASRINDNYIVGVVETGSAGLQNCAKCARVHLFPLMLDVRTMAECHTECHREDHLEALKACGVKETDTALTAIQTLRKFFRNPQFDIE